MSRENRAILIIGLLLLFVAQASGNSPPVAVPESFETHMGTTTSGDVLSEDSLEVIKHTEPSHGTLILDYATGEFEYTPNAGFVGQDRFTYQAKVSDTGVETDWVEVTIDVINELPIANCDMAETSQGKAVDIYVLANDFDLPDNLGYSDDIILEWYTWPSHGNLVWNPTENYPDSTFTYTPNVDFVGQDSFTYGITDGQIGASLSTSTVTITVTKPPSPIEQIEEILNFVDESVTDGTLVGEGKDRTAANKLNEFINDLKNIQILIENESFEKALEELYAVYKKCDGNWNPPDFVTGTATVELAEKIAVLIQSIIDMSGEEVFFLNDVEGIPSLWTLAGPADVVVFTGKTANWLRALEEENHLLNIALCVGLQYDGVISSFLASKGFGDFFDNLAQNEAPKKALRSAGLEGKTLSLALDLFEFLKAYSVAQNIYNSTGDVYIVLPEYPHYEIEIEKYYYNGFLFAADDLEKETLDDLNIWVDAVHFDSIDEEVINPDGYSLGKANWEWSELEYVPVPNYYERDFWEGKWVDPDSWLENPFVVEEDIVLMLFENGIPLPIVKTENWDF
jgi:hypothetical protein